MFGPIGILIDSNCTFLGHGKFPYRYVPIINLKNVSRESSADI
jgi:hypothetical protein